MRIVIEIPNSLYANLSKMANGSIACKRILDCVKNGTPLPKGHGRLIDADEIVAEATERMKYPANHEYMECVIAHMKLAKTIIDADKEND